MCFVSPGTLGAKVTFCLDRLDNRCDQLRGAPLDAFAQYALHETQHTNTQTQHANTIRITQDTTQYTKDTRTTHVHVTRIHVTLHTCHVEHVYARAHVFDETLYTHPSRAVDMFTNARVSSTAFQRLPFCSRTTPVAEVTVRSLSVDSSERVCV